MVSGHCVDCAGDYRALEKVLESYGVERNRLAPAHVAHLYGRRRNLVPVMYFAAAGLVDRRFFDETAKDAKFVEPGGISNRFFCASYWSFQLRDYTIVLQIAKEPGR